MHFPACDTRFSNLSMLAPACHRVKELWPFLVCLPSWPYCWGGAKPGLHTKILVIFKNNARRTANLVSCVGIWFQGHGSQPDLNFSRDTIMPLWIFLLVAQNTVFQPESPIVLGKLEIPGTQADRSGLTGKLSDGSPANRLGGFGSALAATDKPGFFFMLPDRGPGDGMVDFPCRFHRVMLNLPEAVGVPEFTVLGTTLLRDPQGAMLTGGSKNLDHRWDPEGMRVGPWPACVPNRRNRPGQAVFLSEEYGPRVGIFQQDGVLVRELPVPARMRVNKPHADAKTEEAQNAVGRQPNKGFEGLALSPEADTLWVATQGPLLQDHKAANGRWIRLVRYNLEAGSLAGEFVYPLDAPHCGVSEILWVSPNQLLVLERDSFAGKEAKVKRIYLATNANATDVSTLDCLSDAKKPVKPWRKRLLVDLLDPKLGLAGERFPSKWDGMAWGEVLGGARVLWLITDNDFVSKNSTWVLALRIPEGMLRN